MRLLICFGKIIVVTSTQIYKSTMKVNSEIELNYFQQWKFF